MSILVMTRPQVLMRLIDGLDKYVSEFPGKLLSDVDMGLNMSAVWGFHQQSNHCHSLCHSLAMIMNSHHS